MTTKPSVTPTEPHAVYPDGPPCAPACPGPWSEYHDGYSWGYEHGLSEARATSDAALVALREALEQALDRMQTAFRVAGDQTEASAQALYFGIEAAEQARALTLKSEFAEFVVDESGHAFIAAVLAVLEGNGWHLTQTPGGELDRAWQRAEAALPEGWAFGGLYLRRGLDFYRARAYRVGVTHPLRAKPSNDVVLGDGPTPTAALTALAEHLEAPHAD